MILEAKIELDDEKVDYIIKEELKEFIKTLVFARELRDDDVESLKALVTVLKLYCRGDEFDKLFEDYVIDYNRHVNPLKDEDIV
jgi:hypothetical protein